MSALFPDLSAPVAPVSRRITITRGDNLTILRTMASNSLDACVTDPPYGLRFMGKKWDYDVPSVEFWREVYRVLKPGAHVVSFGGTRTYHRLACNIEDAGFEIRDSLHWFYGSGFPKSLDVSKALDKAAGAAREVLRTVRVTGGGMEHVNRTNAATHDYRPDGYQKGENVLDITAPATDEAVRWSGWGTALKPAHEPIVLARKPLDGTVAENIRKWGTGALNIDGCRVRRASGDTSGWAVTGGGEHKSTSMAGAIGGIPFDESSGRWPPNVLLTHDPNCTEHLCVGGCPVAETDGQAGTLRSGDHKPHHIFSGESQIGTFKIRERTGKDKPGDSGGASRFFPVTRYTDDDHPSFLYCAKAARSEREAGCEHLTPRTGAETVDREEGSAGVNSPRAGAGRTAEGVRNHHPTVKPVALMRWCLRLVTPPGGTVLEPFAGSGTTLVASVLEGFACVGIERDADDHGESLGYIDIIEARVARASVQPGLFGGVA